MRPPNQHTGPILTCLFPTSSRYRSSRNYLRKSIISLQKPLDHKSIIVLFAKTVYAFLAVNYFRKKTPSYTFHRVLNLPDIPIPVKTIVV